MPTNTQWVIAPPKKTLVIGVADMAASNDPGAELVTYSLGSCLGISVYDPVKRAGGILHVMLPSSAIDTEKARSEFVIAPVLGEVRRGLGTRFALFSGIEFDVDSARGLNGYCDFIFSRASIQIILTAPVVAIATGGAAIGRFKKLRRAVEEAHVLAGELVVTGPMFGDTMRRATEDDWRFVLDVNLDGVFRVGQTFTKMLLEQGRGGYVVNTASVGGFLSYGAGVAYTVSKYGVVAYSEALRADLESEGIGVSTLCPGPIDTNLPASDRIRGAAERAGGFSEALSPLTRGGMKPDEVGPIVLAGIRNELPYIFTHDDLRDAFAKRFETVLACFDRIGAISST